MAPKTIEINTLTMILVLVAGIEYLAWLTLQIYALPPLVAMGAFRLVQVLAIVMILEFLENGLATVGGAPSDWARGLRQGLVWSFGFGAVAALAMLLMALLGSDPLRMVQAPLPASLSGLVLFFVVGGLIAPIAEELCFRGIIYSFFRRWGVGVALVASTALFVVLHSVSGIPVIQVVGGIVFALAYENTKNLMVPIVIHVTGNIAIFGLSLPGVFR